MQKQLEALMKRRIELANFRIEVNQNLARGEFDHMLVVKDEHGEYPVVTALGNEPLSLLLERVSALGGRANIFVKGSEGVSFILADYPEDGVQPLDLSDGAQWASGESAIDIFLQYLRTQKNGIAMPDCLPDSGLSISVKKDSLQMEESLMLN